MRKILSVILALGVLALLAACGEEEEEGTTPPTFEGITVEDRDPVSDGELDPFAVEKNADITLEIRFSNPDDVEFNTVQINGTTYRAHRFSEDSSPQNLILNLNAGRLTGEETYEIEEIEYIDEEGVKSMQVNEDNAYMLFVMRSTPSVEFEDIITGKDSIEVELAIDDPDQTLSQDPDDSLSQARLEIIHEEDGVLEDYTETVESGFFSHTFDDLESDTTYDFRVVADYETDDPDVDGGVVQDAIIGETTDVTTDAKTAPTITIEDTTYDETSYMFDLNLDDPDEVILEDSLRAEVVQNGDVCGTCDIDLSSLDDIRMDGLLSGTDYTLNIYADYNLNDGSGDQTDQLLAEDTFTTEEKTLGALEATTTSITENSMTLDIDGSALYDSVDIERLDITVTDTDTDEVLHNTEIKGPSNIYELTDLHADQDVRIVISATYYLHEGQETPEEKAVFDGTFTTESNSVPSASIDDVDLSQDGADVSFSLSDPDDTIVADSLTLHLYEDGSDDPVATLTGASAGGDLIEYAVLADKAYTVEIMLDYDLRDDEGVESDVVMDSIYTTATLKDKAPAISINGITADSESIDVDYTISDNDSTIVTDGITLHVNDDAYTLNDLEAIHTVSPLLSDTTHDITLEVAYDLGEGEGAQTLVLEESVTTEAKTAPTFEVTDQETTHDGLSYAVDLTDPDNIATFDTGSILKDGAEVATFNEGEAITGLLSDTEYTMEVTYAYDLNDGSGESTQTETYTFTTAAYEAPSVTITNLESTQEGFSFDYAFTDPDGVLDDTTLTFTYDSTETDLTALEGSIAESGLLSDTAYTPTLEAEYDLNDGKGVRTLTLEDSVTTTAKTAPTYEITDQVTTHDGLSYAVDLTDPDSTATFETARILKDGAEAATFTEGETVSGLLSDTEYTLEVTYTYDLNDGSGESTRTETYTFTTDAYEAPSVTMTNLESTQEGFSFDYAFTDPDGVLDTDSLTFTYDSTETALTGLEGAVSESDLLSDAAYALTIEAEYDLEDGEGVQTLVLEESVTTEARSEATAESDGNTSEAGVSTFDMTISDPDATIVDGSLQAELTDETGTVLETWAPSTGENSLVHHNLIYDETLTLTLTADIDLRDGDDPEATTLLETTLDVPEYVTYEEDTLDEGTFKGTLDISALASVIDDFDTVESTLSYVDYDEEIARANLSNQKLFYDVNGLLADRDIKIAISATYDLGDGEETGEVYSMVIRTAANETPTADLDITDFNVDAGTIDFDAVITDSDEVRLDDSTYAKLYRENSEGDMELYDTMLLDDDPEDDAYTFSGLDLDYQDFYLIEIETDHYLRDGRGNHEGVNLDVDTVVVDVTPDAPDASITNLELDKGYVTFDVDVTDAHDTIQDGSLYAVLMKDGAEVERTELASLDETLTYTELENAEDYSIEILADVDLKEASIRDNETLDTQSFTSYDSTPAVTTSVDTAKGEATIDYTIDDSDDTISAGTFEAVLYQDGTEADRKALTDLSGSVTFTELGNATDYTVELIADVDYGETDIRTEEVLDTVAFTTPDVSPDITFTTDDLDEDTLDFTTDVDDSHQVITDSTLTVEVYDEDDALVTTFTDITDGVDSSLSGLLSDHTYTFRYFADTDYQDGAGIVNRLVHETTETTDAYTEPDATVTGITTTHDQVDFNVALDNPDSLDASITAIDLYKDDSLEDSIPSPAEGSHSFDELLADNAYDIVVTYEYDMLDGEGTQTGTATETITTDAYTEPTVTIDNVAPDDDSVSFDVNETDPDGLNDIDSLELISGGGTEDTIETPGDGGHSFTGLYSNHEYTIRLTHSYDLGDGEGEQTVTVEETFTTDALTAPSASIDSTSVSGGSLTVDISALDDPDGTVTTMSLELYEDGSLVETEDNVDGNSSYTFDYTIEDDKEYTVKLKADYDLNEEDGPQTGVILDETKFINLS